MYSLSGYRRWRCVLVILSLFLFSFSIERKMADDVWRQLGLDKTAGINSIKESFYYNTFSITEQRTLKK